MKCFILFGIAMALIVISGCSESSSYNPQVCKNLQEKIENKEKLTEADYDTMITQLQGIAEKLNEEKAALGEDKDVQKKFAETEGREMFEYILGFGVYLSSHSNELTPANAKKFRKVSEEFDKLKEKD